MITGSGIQRLFVDQVPGLSLSVPIALPDAGVVEIG